MDPYYRTLNGFATLVEKEWCAFGHQFQVRNGMPELPQDKSPIFLQWLDWFVCNEHFSCTDELVFGIPSLILIDHVVSLLQRMANAQAEAERVRVQRKVSAAPGRPLQIRLVRLFISISFFLSRFSLI